MDFIVVARGMEQIESAVAEKLAKQGDNWHCDAVCFGTAEPHGMSLTGIYAGLYEGRELFCKMSRNGDAGRFSLLVRPDLLEAVGLADMEGCCGPERVAAMAKLLASAKRVLVEPSPVEASAQENMAPADDPDAPGYGTRELERLEARLESALDLVRFALRGSKLGLDDNTYRLQLSHYVEGDIGQTAPLLDDLAEKDRRLRELADAQERLDEVLNSRSYKIGLKMTAPARRAKDSRAEKERLKDMRPVAPVERTDGKRIIASLTTFPMRIDAARFSIESILGQTLRPDEVVLWLAKEQFPEGDGRLPDDLLALCDQGLRIRWCEDFKSYKKLICPLRDYPDDLVVTFDDDLLYDSCTIEELYRAHLRFPDAVCGVRTHRIEMTSDGSIAPYSAWQKDCSDFVLEPRRDLIATTGAGTLFPPKCMHEDASDWEKVRRLAPGNDDIWAKFMQLLAGTPVVLARPVEPLVYVPGTQEEFSLWSRNKLASGNDAAIAALVAEYGNPLA